MVSVGGWFRRKANTEKMMRMVEVTKERIAGGGRKGIGEER